MNRIVVDAMGGDHAPDEILAGAAEASLSLRNAEIILVGDAAQGVHRELQARGLTSTAHVDLEQALAAARDAGVACVRDENGAIRNTLASTVDSTDRKLAEQALEKRALQLRTIFHSSPLGILYVGKDGTILDCNHRHAELMGSTRKKQIGVNLLQELN